MAKKWRFFEDVYVVWHLRNSFLRILIFRMKSALTPSFCHAFLFIYLERLTRARSTHGKDFQMRSVKLLVAAAAVAALVAGPVMAQDATSTTPSTSTSSTTAPAKAKHHKKSGKHHHSKKTAAPATTPAPAAQ